jgi:3-hydroxyisobutyrate dehydrogenase
MNSFNRISGFIGLGAMGSRLVRRIIDAGFEVIVFDRTHEKAQAAAAHGATAAPTPRELAAKSGVIMSCLSNDDAVRAIYCGGDGVIMSVPPGSIIIEMSTISPETSRNLSQAGEERRVEVLDVAISGGPPMRRKVRLLFSRAAANEHSKTVSPFSRV